MKKMSRKIAAIIAAAMTATTMSVMNVFAADLTLSDGENGTKTGSVDLNVRVIDGDELTYISNRVWDIDIDATELTWVVKHNLGVQTLIWNSVSGAYDVGPDAVDGYEFNRATTGANSNFSGVTDDDAANDFDKSVTLTNKCNFAVNFTATASNGTGVSPTEGDAAVYGSALFSVVAGYTNSMNAYDATSKVTIRPNPSAIESYLNNGGKTAIAGLNVNDTNSKLRLGSASFTFTGSNTLFNYGSGENTYSVGDGGTGSGNSNTPLGG